MQVAGGTGRALARCRGGHCALDAKRPGKQGRPKWSSFKQMDEKMDFDMGSSVKSVSAIYVVQFLKDTNGSTICCTITS